MKNVFRQFADLFLRQLPLGSIKHSINLLLSTLEVDLQFRKLFLNHILLLKDLEIPMQVIPNILKESIKVLFNDLMHASQRITPFNSHIVHRHEDFIQSMQTLRLRHSI